MEIQVPCLLQAETCNTDTTPTQPHRNSNTHRTKNNMTNVVIQQNSRKLLMMDILMSETCWAHKKWNKIASDIKSVFYSSTKYIIFNTAVLRQVVRKATKYTTMNCCLNLQTNLKHFGTLLIMKLVLHPVRSLLRLNLNLVTKYMHKSIS